MSRDPATLAQAFVALVGQEIEDDRIDLVRAALVIARTEYPNLDLDAYCARIEDLARRVKRHVPDLGDPSESVAALNRVLFEEEGFRGNAEDYYDPRNSFLNEVLDRKLGIPITLAVVYMEVARRVGFPLVGVGMPGHFLLKHYDVEGPEIVIDPFNRGSIVTASDCQRFLDQIYGGQLQLQPEFLPGLTAGADVGRLAEVGVQLSSAWAPEAPVGLLRPFQQENLVLLVEAVEQRRYFVRQNHEPAQPGSAGGAKQAESRTLPIAPSRCF